MTSLRHAAFGSLFVLGLAACATPPPTTTDDTPPPSSAGDKNSTGECNASTLGWAMGQAADASLVARAQAEAGAKTVRVLRPGMMVTQEYNAARLDLRVDNDGKVIHFECG
jgi:hypothetical protein